MKKYNVHFSGYYGFDVEVEANNREEAEEKAEELSWEIDANEWEFSPAPNDVWEVEE